jgi:hypothetical protein
MYDEAVGTQMSPSLAGLARPAALHLHPLDLARFGDDGVELKVTSAKSTLVMPAIGDAGLPRGAAFIEFNQRNIPVGELIDCSAPVTDLKIETM